jgi:cytochrome c-type biogenesis protein CcmE
VHKRAKFVVASAVILVTLGWLGYIGAMESKTYYYTIEELDKMGARADSHRLRVGGDIQAGSIERLRGRVDFIIAQEGRTLRVSYVGGDPLPDTFVDGAQALVEGKRMPDGRFVAEKVQAKCASKYEADPSGKAGYGAPGTQPQAAPASPEGKS